MTTSEQRDAAQRIQITPGCARRPGYPPPPRHCTICATVTTASHTPRRPIAPGWLRHTASSVARSCRDRGLPRHPVTEAPTAGWVRTPVGLLRGTWPLPLPLARRDSRLGPASQTMVRMGGFGNSLTPVTPGYGFGPPPKFEL